MSKIVVRNLSKRFPGYENFALSNVSFSVNPGEILGILGPNGSGKTTLIKSLLGLLKPSSGSIEINNQILYRSFWPSVFKSKNQDIGCVLNAKDMIFSHLLAVDSVQYYGMLKGLSPKDSFGAAIQYLEGFDLDPYAPAQIFSDGMVQKVGLACAFIGEPNIYILDEPLRGIDQETKIKIKNLLIQHAREGGIVLISTHDLSIIESLATNLLVLNDGRVQSYGQAHEVLSVSHPFSMIRVIAGIVNHNSVSFLEDIGYEYSIEGDNLILDLNLENQDFLKHLIDNGFNIKSVNPLNESAEKLFVSSTICI